MALKVTETMNVFDFRVVGILTKLEIGSTGVFNDGMAKKLTGLEIVLIDVFESGITGLLANLESEQTGTLDYEVTGILVKLPIVLIGAFSERVTRRLVRLERVPVDVVNCGVSPVLIKLNTELMSPFECGVAGVVDKLYIDSMDVCECRVDRTLAFLKTAHVDEFECGISNKCDKGDVKSQRHLYRIIELICIQTNTLECSHIDIISMSKNDVCNDMQIVSNDWVEHFANDQRICVISKSNFLQRSYSVGYLLECMKENKYIDMLIPSTYRCKYENNMSSLVLGLINQSPKMIENTETESNKIACHCNGFIPSTFECNYENCMFSFSLGEIKPLRVMFDNFETELDKRMHCFCKPLCTFVAKTETITSLVIHKECRPMNSCSTSSKIIDIRTKRTHFSNFDYFIYIICIMFILTSGVCLKLLRNIICKNILTNFFLHSPKLSRLKNKDIDKALLHYLLNFKAPDVQQNLHVYPVSRQSIDSTLALEQPEHSSLSKACMSNELIRVSTFSNFPQTGTSLIKLAAAGFYYSEENTDEVICFSCGLRVTGWRTGANPLTVHKQLAPGCEHVREIISPDPTEYLSKAESRAQSHERHDAVYEPAIFTDAGNNNLVSSYHNSVRNERSTAECQLHGTNDKTSPSSLTLQAHNRSVGTTDLESFASHRGQNERYGSTLSRYNGNTGRSLLTRSSSSDSGYESELSLSNPLLGNGSRTSQFPSQEHSFGQCTNNDRTENRTRYQRELSMDGNIDFTDNIERLSLITEEPQAYSFRGLDHARQDHGNFQVSNESNPFPNSHRSLKKKYPEYESLQKRRESFRNWPANKNFLHVYDLAQCGFFFTNYEDCVRCFDCGIGLKNWETEDNVWIEHARWSRKCPYLLQIKGQEFMESVQKILQTDETTRHNSNIEKDVGVITTEYNATPRNPLEHTAARYVLTERIFEDEELVKLCMQTLLQSIGWDSITNENLVSSILEIVTERDSSNMVNTNELPMMTDDEGYSTQHPSTQQSILYQSKGDNIVDEPSTGIYTERKAKPDDDPMKIEKENEDLRELHTCKICLDEKVCITFVPCGHLVTCQTCSPKLRKCPLCRTFIRRTIKTTIFL